MLGNFQQSHLRIEVEAPARTLEDSLLHPGKLRQWLWVQQISPVPPEQFYSGFTFTAGVEPVVIKHQVEVANSHCLRLLLSQGIDGYQEWRWGEGWVQCRLEGISLLPLNLLQTLSLLRLRQFVASQSQTG